MSADPIPYLPVNHVFVDLENVKSIDTEAIANKNLRFHLFLGLQNKWFNVETVQSLMTHSHAVQLIRSPKDGKNALDFVLAYHLGQAVLMEPKAYFHIVSKDAGFDSLVELLKSKHVKVRRHENWASLNLHALQKAQATPQIASAEVKKVAAKKVAKKVATKTAANPVVAKKMATKNINELSPGDCYLRVWDNFLKTPKSLPARRKTLLAKIGQLIAKDAESKNVAAIVKRLENAGVLTFSEKDIPKYSF